MDGCGLMWAWGRIGETRPASQVIRLGASSDRSAMSGAAHPGKHQAARRAQPARRRDQVMKRFKSPRQLRRLLSTHDQSANAFAGFPNQDTAAKFHFRLQASIRHLG
jgi:hypothetical protein